MEWVKKIEADRDIVTEGCQCAICRAVRKLIAAVRLSEKGFKAVAEELAEGVGGIVDAEAIANHTRSRLRNGDVEGK